MDDKKPWYTSKGVMGSAGTVIAGILGIWYVGIEAEQVTAVLVGAGTVISGVVALIGRIKAKQPIGK